MAFEDAFEKLNELDGFQGAAVISVDAQSVLAQTESVLDMQAAALGWSASVRLEQDLLGRLDVQDFMRVCTLTTREHQHVLMMVPYFDNVVLYAVFHRKVPYVLFNKYMLDAMDLMVSPVLC